jgi:hypothetical protein
MINEKSPRFQDIPQITRARYSVTMMWHHLENWLHEQNVDMDPDYQRDYVWTQFQKEKYIEWILRNGASGKDIFFNHPGWFKEWKGRMEIVDGKQRVEAVLSFLNNKVKVYGYYLNQYADKLDYLTCNFTIHVLDLESRELVLKWYLDMNSGGTIHTETEIQKVKDLLYGIK